MAYRNGRRLVHKQKKNPKIINYRTKKKKKKASFRGIKYKKIKKFKILRKLNHRGYASLCKCKDKKSTCKGGFQ